MSRKQPVEPCALLQQIENKALYRIISLQAQRYNKLVAAAREVIRWRDGAGGPDVLLFGGEKTFRNLEKELYDV